MNRPYRFALFLLALAALVLTPRSHIAAQTYDQQLFGEMRWRPIGPLRGGRVKAITGVAGQPGVFYMAQVNGGVWKTNDYGRTWTPIFDDQPTGSIGAIAVAPSDPNVVYVGSGEGLHRPDLSTGDGVYKSTDAGRTWTRLGLRDGQQIPFIAVDPHDANRLFVAVLGHPYGPNEERGVFRSTDGGRTFQKVLYKDENTGASDVEIDPSNPNLVYACLWEAREGPWENAAWAGTGGGIFKSTDGGSTWHPLAAGLPAEGVVQADVAIAPSQTSRLYATVASPTAVGIYRSDDAGDHWTRITTDTRPAGRIGGGDLPVPAVDPKNPDVVVIASTVSYRSTDGGRTWVGFRGAPGGDDYQRPWISPDDSNVVALASDQGAVITVNGGATWSSWYNQPTAQLYHVGTDNAFPYRVCSGQQESGSACVSSRGAWGEITERDWSTAGIEEYGYATPDPLNADIVYGGKVERFDRRTGQVQQVAPTPIRTPDYRVVRTQPVVFSPINPRLLYFASNRLWTTLDGGRSWRAISPDLTRKTWDVPASVGKYRSQPSAQPSQRGVIYTVAPSPIAAGRIWIGTDDGLIQVTSDAGLHWRDVTPKALVPWAKVSIMDAGHFDAQTAYAAINTLRLDDLRPHIYRTHDGGATWTEIVSGIPDGAPVNVVREDPKRKGMLYAGTEREVYVSFDDGDHWQSLRLNMPATSVRDLVVKNDDLVVGTHGRGFWILDDITPLRQLDDAIANADVTLFQPQDAFRVRWNVNTDTPLPPDEPTAVNPPDGAIIDYVLKAPAQSAVTLEIVDAAGQLVRRYASNDPIEPVTPANAAVPVYWYAPPQVLSTDAGMHRFVWDLHYPSLRDPESRALPIAAVPHRTAPAPLAPWVMPGRYTVKLTVGGQTYSQPLVVKMDPRVRTSLAGLQQQFTVSKRLYDDLSKVIDALGPAERSGAQPGAAQAPSPLTQLRDRLRTMLTMVQESDTAPTSQAVAAAAQLHRDAATVSR